MVSWIIANNAAQLMPLFVRNNLDKLENRYIDIYNYLNLLIKM